MPALPTSTTARPTRLRATAWSPPTTTVSSCDLPVRTCPSPGRRSRGTVGLRISAVDEIRMRPPPEGGRISRPRGGHTRIWSRTGLPHPPSSPRSRAPTNGPAEAMPRLVGPRTRGPGARFIWDSSAAACTRSRCTTLPARQIWPRPLPRAYSGPRVSDCERTCPSPGRRSRGTVGLRISAVDEIRMRPPPEGGRIPRPRGGHTRIWSPTGLPHPPSSPRSRAPTNGPAEAMPRLVGPRPRGPLRAEADDVRGDHRCTLPPLSCSVTGSLTRGRMYRNINELTLVARVRQGHVSRGRRHEVPRPRPRLHPLRRRRQRLRRRSGARSSSSSAAPTAATAARAATSIAEAVEGLNTLIDFRYQQHFFAKNGQRRHGQPDAPAPTATTSS